MDTKDFFTEYGEANRYQVNEVIGKGSYGVVCSATDTQSCEKVAIKKINNVFDHVSDATRILREIKLLRMLKHPGKMVTLWAGVVVGLGAESLAAISRGLAVGDSWVAGRNIPKLRAFSTAIH